MRLSFSAKHAIAKLAIANVIHLVHIASHLREIEKSFSYRYVRVLFANVTPIVTLSLSDFPVTPL